ncbi:MAG TPA: phosphoribosyltransferase [Baekduia sp.]|uniref:phosphoribosyltransferase n=1 Tax=Baekduia sp. TaxID=2600305 RepID=UPI002BF66F83|nr:phosphoribosyltransferase [Baekduia sp.]HMJ37889.1 phosphoribosyltransferase [Baekduia sp.]
MQIDVAELRNGALPHSSEYDDLLVPWRRVLYAPVPRWTHWGEIDSLLYELDSEIRSAAELVVLRAHQPDAARLLASEDLRRELELRHNHRPVYLLCWEDGGYAMRHLAGAETDVPDQETLLALLRDAELGALIAQPNVELPHAAEAHYIGPNGQHYNSFIRIGTAIQSIDRLDGVTFWLLRFVDGATLVILDSWTIMSVGLNLSRYTSEAGVKDLSVVGVECQGRYDEDAGQLEARVDALIEHLLEDGTPPTRALIVGSTSSTGDSIGKLSGVCETLDLPVTTVALFAPGNDHADAVFRHRSELGQRWENRETCERCAEGAAWVEISPTTYHLHVTASVEYASVTQDLAQRLQPFFDRYRGKDLFRVHAWQHDDRSRHHMLDIDVLKMLVVPAFRTQLDERVSSLPEFDVILTPEHPAAVSLAAAVADLTGRDVVRRLPGDLEVMAEGDRAKLRGRKILLVDDVVVTGTRLHVYRQALQRAGLTDGGSELRYLVGLARPASNERLRTIRNTVHGPHNFHPVETLLLPHWDDEQCPWCWEHRRLRDLGPGIERSERLSARLEALEQPGGLADDLFLRWGDEKERFWDLGPQSLFHTDTQAELFVNVCAALQELRGRRVGGLNESYSTPVARVMDPEFFISGTYYVPVIKAAVLRAAHTHDVRAHKHDPEIRKEIVEKLREPEWQGLVPELAFAMGRRELPPIDDVLHEDDGDPVMAELLQRLVALGR